MYSEGKESIFSHYGKKYRVDDLLRLTGKSRVRRIPISELKWIFDYADPDPERAAKASLAYPLVVTKGDVDGEERYIVIDGTHRLAKAIQTGRLTVQCFIVDKDAVKNLPEVT